MLAPDTIFTYRDLIDRLLQQQNLDNAPKNINTAKIAVSDALRTLSNSLGNWKWYARRFMFTCSPSVDLNVTFDVSTKICTINSGAIPSDLEYGMILFDNKLYDIKNKLSSNTFNFTDATTPDRTFTQSVAWARDRYSVPNTIRNINEVWCVSRMRRLHYFPESEVTAFQRLATRLGAPFQFNYSSSKNTLGKLELRLSPAPEIAEQMEVNCYVAPRNLSVLDVDGLDGVVTGTSFTSASAFFKPAVEGAIVRFSSTGQPPRGRWSYDEKSKRPEYDSQHVITKYISPTEVTIDSPVGDGSGLGFTISDYVDIDVDTHLNFLEAIATERFMINKNYDPANIGMAVQRRTMAGRQALEANSRVNWNVEWGQFPWMFDTSLIYDFTAHKHSQQ